MRTRRCGWTFCPFTQHLLVVLKEFRSLGIQFIRKHCGKDMYHRPKQCA